jgi:ferritin-like metal-binding protein YciE
MELELQDGSPGLLAMPQARRAGAMLTPMMDEANMAETNTLHDAFIEELRDIYDAEQQITRSLPRMAEAATSADLRAGFEAHLEETRDHVMRVEQALAMLDEKARAKHCDGMAGILDEGTAVLKVDSDDMSKDARLIAAAQRVEHYEMAVYGTLVTWARAMGHSEVADLLQMNLDEEKMADANLTALAEGGINQQAAQLAHLRGQ